MYSCDVFGEFNSDEDGFEKFDEGKAWMNGADDNFHPMTRSIRLNSVRVSSAQIKLFFNFRLGFF